MSGHGKRETILRGANFRSWPWAMAAFALIAVRPVRESVLRAAGWALVVNETVVPADFIVLSLDSGGSGALEAADLLQNGVSKRVWPS